MNDSTQMKRPNEKSLYISVAFVILIMLANYYWLHENGNRGVLGDMFGFSSALFSGLAICGLVYTLNSQKQIIELHWESLATANLQAKYSIQSFRLQALTSALQTIEQQIETSKSITRDNERLQKVIKLEEKKKQIESEIYSTIEKIIKNQN